MVQTDDRESDNIVSSPRMVALALLAAVLIGDPLPALSLQPLDGKPAVVLPDTIRGRVTVIDFFATWCVPCRESLPALERLRSRFAPAGVVFLTISEDGPGTRARVAGFVRELHLGSRVLVDPDRSAFERLGARRLPTTYVVDGRGVVRKINNGTGRGYEARMARWLAQLTTAATPP